MPSIVRSKILVFSAYIAKRGDESLNKPPALTRGDTVQIVAPASPVKEEAVRLMQHYLMQLGLDVQLGRHIFEQDGYLAGSDDLRLKDLQHAIENPNIKAIFCARGGYGSARLLPHLDITPLLLRPKIFWGYSDITYLHAVMIQQAKMITFHGPMSEEYGTTTVHPNSLSALQQLFIPRSLTLYASQHDYPAFSHSIRAPIIGGNITVLVGTLGTPYEIDTNGRILILEDVDEEPYAIDRLLNQLRLSGKLQNCAGIIVADFHDCKPKKGKQSLSLTRIVYDHIVSAQVPILGGFPIGHCRPNYAIPLGGYAIMNGLDRTLLLEPGVASPC